MSRSGRRHDERVRSGLGDRAPRFRRHRLFAQLHPVPHRPAGHVRRRLLRRPGGRGERTQCRATGRRGRSPTARPIEALDAARDRLAAGTSSMAFPVLRAVPPAENSGRPGGPPACRRAGQAIRPCSAAPSTVPSSSVPKRSTTASARASSSSSMRQGAPPCSSARASPRPDAPIERVVTAQAAGNLQMLRRLLRAERAGRDLHRHPAARHPAAFQSGRGEIEQGDRGARRGGAARRGLPRQADRDARDLAGRSCRCGAGCWAWAILFLQASRTG